MKRSRRKTTKRFFGNRKLRKEIKMEARKFVRKDGERVTCFILAKSSSIETRLHALAYANKNIKAATNKCCDSLYRMAVNIMETRNMTVRLGKNSWRAFKIRMKYFFGKSPLENPWWIKPPPPPPLPDPYRQYGFTSDPYKQIGFTSIAY